MKRIIFKTGIVTFSLLLFSFHFSFAQTKFNRSIPDEAHEKMGDYLKYGISTFAFAPNGGWVIVTKNGKSFARNIPDECFKKMNEFLKNGHKIEHISFPPKGGNSWLIITDKGMFARNIPDDCYKQLVLYKKQGKAINMVAFPTKRSSDDSWVILRKDGGFFARNIDDECYQIMKNLSEPSLPNQEAPRKIDYVAFKPDGGWLVLAEDYHFARNIDDECFEKMNAFRKSRSKMKIIAFTPNGKGWSIISNKKFRTRPNDIIRNFESNVGGKSVWQRMRDYNVPGASVAVVIDGQVVWSTAYGHLKNGDRKNAVHPESMFQSASISKVLAAIGAYEMTEQNLVQINDNLQNTLNSSIPIHPCLTLTDTSSVTLRNILRHDSGIDGNVTNAYETQLTNGGNCPRIQEGGYIGYSQSTAVRDLPTTANIMEGSGKATTQKVRITYNNSSMRFTYSGPAFTTLQQLTEELSNQKYDTWMKTNILNPLGMTESRFTTNPESVYDKRQLTWGYDIGKKKNVRNRYPEFAAAGLYTNAEELANVVVMLNNAGQFNNRNVLTAANTTTLIGGQGLRTSDGNISANNSFYCHGGSNEGYRAFMIGFPNINGDSNGVSSSGIIVMTNGDSRDFRYELVNAVIQAYGW